MRTDLDQSWRRYEEWAKEHPQLADQCEKAFKQPDNALFTALTQANPEHVLMFQTYLLLQMREREYQRLLAATENVA